MTDSQRARRAYASDNEQVAEIIIRDPARYPAGSLPQQWAALVIEKATPKIEGPLFARRVA